MEEFLGYGLANSAYDGRRHVDNLVGYYAFYKIVANTATVRTIVMNSLQMNNYVASANYLCNNLYDSSFQSFLTTLQNRYGLTNDEMTVIKSHLHFTTRIQKTPAAYTRYDNITLIAHHAYIHRYFTPANGAAIQQIVNQMKPLFLGMRGNITETDVNKIYSIVNREIQTGNLNLSSIETKVHSMVP